MTWIPQVRKCTRQASYCILSLRKIKLLFSQKHRQRLVQSLVLSRLDFNNSVYILLACPYSGLTKIQLVQNEATRLVTGLSRRDHISPTLQSLHWLPISARVDLKALCMICRAYYNLGPQYLTAMIKHYSPARTLRSNSALLVLQPTSKLQTKGGRSLKVRGAELWNNLPPFLGSMLSILAFWKALKTLLFSHN